MELLLLCSFIFFTFVGGIRSEYGMYSVRCHDDSDPARDTYCPKDMKCCDNGGCCRNGYTCCTNTCCYGQNCCSDLSNSLNADSHDLTDELNAGVIAGIVIGSLAELGLMAAMVIIAAKHKMKKTKVGCVNNLEPHLPITDATAANGNNSIRS
ncbi:uncharacterized protein LOC127843907 [Dreissena polymorpha]|uniref:uncharacterized protein LOC127843907 n=1 Tax=Dreissena polymorpha TaxID=45954 RepID=UPI002264D666|nr:uncharacterized protein LOC127843907 [Dreissena polymorpha]